MTVNYNFRLTVCTAVNIAVCTAVIIAVRNTVNIAVCTATNIAVNTAVSIAVSIAVIRVNVAVTTICKIRYFQLAPCSILCNYIFGILLSIVYLLLIILNFIIQLLSHYSLQ